jgi:hypothetical protein
LLYEKLEPVLNGNELELLDAPTLIEQLVSLVWRGTKIGHESNSHDDHATALALAVSVARAAITRTLPKYHAPFAWSKSSGVISDPCPTVAAERSTTQRFYENGGYGGGGRYWPGSGPTEW